MEKTTSAPIAKRQIGIILLVFGILLVLLGLAYYSFVRTDYAILYSGLRPADASAIVAELDAKSVAYKLRDKGSTILVSEGEVDTVRLAIVRSDAPLKGSTGFELFNKSDMGLTDFAQKINYQRALQGELARTIMMMDGIEDARVHLSIPDRSLFRGNRSEPKAAVTITGQRGRVIDAARVSGIQRLVAAAVPDLGLSRVVVLDEFGRVISQSAEPDAALPPAMEERAAVQQYYRARVRSAVEGALPALQFDVRAFALPLEGLSVTQGWGATAAAEAADKGSEVGQRRDFQLRISIVTATQLTQEEQNLARNAAISAAGLSQQGGDTIDFMVGPLAVPIPAPRSPGVSAPAVAPFAGPGPASVSNRASWPLSWIVALAALVGALALLFNSRARQPVLSLQEREVFIQRIRHQLSPVEEVEDVRA